jgi:superfamily II DNA or RNA helicase
LQSGNHTPPPYLISGYLESRQFNKVTYPEVDTEGTATTCANSEHCSKITSHCRFPKKNHFLLVTPLTRAGTGKTYASAFAMRELEYKKVLFLVHRNQIAKQAKKSFRNVFGDSVSMGMISGTLGRSDYDKDYIFATIQTFCKESTLQHFAKDHFDAIIYDEAHHIIADSYKKVMDYFTPQFTLGMTATPDRPDDKKEGRNIYEMFNYQIAYEIRLKEAMEERLLCTFHYYGITDLSVISDSGKTRKEQDRNFRFLTSDERVEHVITNAEFFGYSGDRVKGLIFCSLIEEARTLSLKLNERGLRTEVLTGYDSEMIRANAIERLAGEDGDNALDYILSVDVFSEGVDIPEINQIIMLRPTESPIVFIQQLGRGLRKSENKKYVVVLDFIGNYTNNYMIPIALSGDRSFNKDNIRRYVAEGGRSIPGGSTVHFDEISRKRIYQAIDNANFSDVKLIKDNYFTLKSKLGHIPALADFDKYGEMDVLRIFDNTSLGSYYKFLVKYDNEYKVRLSASEEKVIEFISKKFANGKRIYELELLNRMLSYRQALIGKLRQTLQEKYAIQINENTVDGLIKIMTNEFQPESSKKNYESCVFIEKEDTEEEYGISKTFDQMLNNIDFYNIVKELVSFGISRYKANYQNRYQNTDFVLYQKYTYEDVCRILGWKKNLSSVMNGYLLDKQTKTFPVFVNYDKTENISDTTKYEDHFISSDKLIAISKSGRSEKSEDVQNFIHARERGIDVQLFVRKNKDDKISKEFYYLGRMHASGFTKEFTMANTDKKAVEIEWILDTPVREDVYEYIVRG